MCYHLSAPSARWPGGTCFESEDQADDATGESPCVMWGYPAGRCAPEGYPHKCIGNYGIPFWFKDVDCVTCTTPDTSEGTPCP